MSFWDQSGAQAATDRLSRAAEDASRAATQAVESHTKQLEALNRTLLELSDYVGLSLSGDGAGARKGKRAGPPTGSLMFQMYDGASEPPKGWLECDGTTFEARRYPELATELHGTISPLPQTGYVRLPSITDLTPVGHPYRALVGIGRGRMLIRT